jgi:hypothetical protein
MKKRANKKPGKERTPVGKKQHFVSEIKRKGSKFYFSFCCSCSSSEH